MAQGRPSHLELFVCQRVSAELQPLLDGWRDAVRRELVAVREASADAVEWREAVSAELAELRGEQQRAAESLAGASARLAEAPPVRLQKKLEQQQQTLVASLQTLQDELGETRRTFERTEAGTSKERRQLVKAAQDEKASALAASELERLRAEERVSELERRLQTSEAAARAATDRASSSHEESNGLRVAVMRHEGAEAARIVAEERIREANASLRAVEALAARQAVHCSILGEAVVEAERIDDARQWEELAAAHRAAEALAAAAARHEARRTRVHAEWLAATQAVVPTLATTAQTLVGRLEVVADRAEGISSGIEAWRGRALRAEDDARQAEETRCAEESKAAKLSDELAMQREVASALAVHVRILVATLQEAEADVRELRTSVAAATHASVEVAAAVRDVAPLHDAVVALTADLLAPMRTLELDATATALRDADALVAANARAAKAESTALQVFSSAEAAWREERAILAATREAAMADTREAASQVPPLKEKLSKAATREAVLEERVVALEKELSAALASLPVAASERDKAVTALKEDLLREREAAMVERQAHAAERAELTGQAERARQAAVKAADDAAAALSHAADESRTSLTFEREASAAREAVALNQADAARTELERFRAEAEAFRRTAADEHAAALAAANERVAERAEMFELEIARQRERAEALVADAKSAMVAQHESALRAAAESTAAAEARVDAAQQNASIAAEHHQQQLRSLAREHAAALRSERQLAAQEISALRDRAEDAERRLDAERHHQASLANLSARESPPRISMRRADAEDSAVETPWADMRRQQAALGTAHAQRLQELSGGGSTQGRRTSSASAALLRRAMAMREAGVPVS